MKISNKFNILVPFTFKYTAKAGKGLVSYQNICTRFPFIAMTAALFTENVINGHSKEMEQLKPTWHPLTENYCFSEPTAHSTIS